MNRYPSKNRCHRDKGGISKPSRDWEGNRLEWMMKFHWKMTSEPSKHCLAHSNVKIFQKCTCGLFNWSIKLGFFLRRSRTKLRPERETVQRNSRIPPLQARQRSPSKFPVWGPTLLLGCCVQISCSHCWGHTSQCSASCVFCSTNQKVGRQMHKFVRVHKGALTLQQKGHN